MTTGIAAIILAIYSPVLIFLRITKGEDAAFDWFFEKIGPSITATLEKIFR